MIIYRPAPKTIDFGRNNLGLTVVVAAARQHNVATTTTTTTPTTLIAMTVITAGVYAIFWLQENTLKCVKV